MLLNTGSTLLRTTYCPAAAAAVLATTAARQQENVQKKCTATTTTCIKYKSGTRLIFFFRFFVPWLLDVLEYALQIEWSRSRVAWLS